MLLLKNNTNYSLNKVLNNVCICIFIDFLYLNILFLTPIISIDIDSMNF